MNETNESYASDFFGFSDAHSMVSVRAISHPSLTIANPLSSAYILFIWDSKHPCRLADGRVLGFSGSLADGKIPTIPGYAPAFVPPRMANRGMKP
jgi:hypothetical protein